MKSFILLLFFSLLASAQYKTANLPNGYASESTDPKELQISVIDLRTAEKLYATLIDDKTIPYGYPYEGCYARATAMSQIAEKQNIITGRIVVEGKLQAKLDLLRYPIVRWKYWHVAPVAYVKQLDGTIVLMAFDPTLASRPIETTKWLNSLLYDYLDYKPFINEVYYGNRFQYFTRNSSSGNQDIRREGYRTSLYDPNELGNDSIEKIFKMSWEQLNTPIDIVKTP